VLQISFASADAMHALKYYDMITQHSDDWMVCEMLSPGLADDGWFGRWCCGLQSASACLVIFTPNYRDAITQEEMTPLRLEAAEIKRRVQGIRQVFGLSPLRVFVLNPFHVGQDYANLKLYLERNEPSLNVNEWLNFIDASKASSRTKPEHINAGRTRGPEPAETAACFTVNSVQMSTSC